MLQKENNRKFDIYLSHLDATKNTNYSLWRATKHLKVQITTQPPILKPNQTGAKSNVEKSKFADYLEEVFTLNNLQEDVKTEIYQYLSETYQLDMPIKKFSIAEVKTAIKTKKRRIMIL